MIPITDGDVIESVDDVSIFTDSNVYIYIHIPAAEHPRKM